MSRLLILVWVTCVLVGVACAQQPRDAGVQGHIAPNAWMKTPTMVGRSPVLERIPSTLRLMRDIYFDDTIGGPESLRPDLSDGAISESSTFGEAPEVHDYRNRALIIGKFTAFQSVLSQSRRAIYTEIAINPEQVFEDAGAQLPPGQALIVAVPGGTVETADRQILHMFTGARERFLEPGHTYFLSLQFHRKGEFFTLRQAWDLSDGTARPGVGVDVHRVREGRSVIAGKTKEQLTRLLSEMTSQSKQQ